MFRSCEETREAVEKICSEIRDEGFSRQDPETVRMAFFHIYYCLKFDNKCGEMWCRLNKEEKNPLIRSWLENWTHEPIAGFNITAVKYI